MTQNGKTNPSEFEREKPVGTMKEILAAITWVQNYSYQEETHGNEVVSAEIILKRLNAIKEKFKAGE
jgi:plasmid replication initiation protein|tara:strand:- start:1026 stop:1226 length:201 start_codon:yes stop_codon:yes gene_type:complete